MQIMTSKSSIQWLPLEHTLMSASYTACSLQDMVTQITNTSLALFWSWFYDWSVLHHVSNSWSHWWTLFAFCLEDLCTEGSRNLPFCISALISLIYIFGNIWQCIAIVHFNWNETTNLSDLRMFQWCVFDLLENHPLYLVWKYLGSCSAGTSADFLFWYCFCHIDFPGLRCPQHLLQVVKF